MMRREPEPLGPLPPPPGPAWQDGDDELTWVCRYWRGVDAHFDALGVNRKDPRRTAYRTPSAFMPLLAQARVDAGLPAALPPLTDAQRRAVGQAG
jgi:hypothetical protein